MAHRRTFTPLALAVALLLAFFPVHTVHAAAFNVNSAADTVDADLSDGFCRDAAGYCTLRAAIMQANVSPEMDTINLPARTYTLTLAGRDENNAATGDLDILGSITIIGSNGSPDSDPALTIIQAGTDPANGIDKVFSINPNHERPFITTFRALTIRHGYNTSTSPTHMYGGGIDWDASGTGSLTLYNCVISNNTSLNAGGGGLSASNSVGSASGPLVTINRTIFTNNRTLHGDGGGILMDANVPFTMTDSVVSNNSAEAGGADFGRGGGMAYLGTLGKLSTITGSTFNGNWSRGQEEQPSSGGGGIYALGDLQISHSTISGNSASGSGGGGMLMGVALTNVTITNNHCNAAGSMLGVGGGIDTASNTATVLRNTIAAGNVCGSTASSLSGMYDTSNSFNNLIGAGDSGGFANGANGNLVGILDPRLAPLANNGGRTQTHALLPGSLALDAGNNDFSPVSFDQRGSGFNRVMDAADADLVKTIDIGAYEASAMIEDLPDRTIPANTTFNYEFNYGDYTVASPSFTFASSNTALVPIANISVMPGASGKRNLGIVPATNQSGVSTITLNMNCSGTVVSDSFVLTVIPHPDFVVSKTHTGNFYQGQSGANFTITTKNQGMGAATGEVTVTDTLPSGLTATALGGEGWTCTLNTMTCTRSDGLASNSSYPPITLTVDVSASAPASLTNRVAVSNALDSNSSNNTGTDSVQINAVADLVVVKTHTADFRQGQNGAAYTLVVSNQGSVPTSGLVTLTDALPSGMSAAGMSGTGWSCSLDTLTCTRSTVLNASASYPPVTLTVNVTADAPAELVNTAQVSGGGEAVTSNNTASDLTVIEQAADLTAVVWHSGDFRQGQQNAIYELTVRNSGSGPTVGLVTIKDTLPTGLKAASMSGSGWECNLPTQTCTRSDVLPAGASYPAISLSVDVASDAPAAVTNIADVSGGGELVTGNNTASDPTTIIQAADLTVTKTHSGDFRQAQRGALFSLTVSNSGPGASVGEVVLRDTLPSALTPVEMSGEGWNCDLTTLACTRSDVLAADTSYPPVILKVDVDSQAGVTLTNQADIQGGGELNTANNHADDQVSVIPLPDLEVTVTPGGTFEQGQTGAQYTIQVSNKGNATTNSTVSVTDTLPDGLSTASLTGEGWDCELAALSCQRSDTLAAGDSYPPVTLTVNVAADAAESLTNTAMVSGGEELSLDNNSGICVTAVTQRADLTVTKTHTGAFRQGQTTAEYRLTVTNAGRGATTGEVLLEELLPAGLTAVELSGEGWVCSLSTLTCTRADALAAGGSYPAVTVKVDVEEDAPDTLANRARISGGGELVTGNNTAEDATIIYTRPVITLHPQSQPVWLGQMAVLTAAASGNPAPEVLWQVSNDRGDTWSDLTEETSTTLSFTMTPERSGVYYRAVFTNMMGSAATGAAVLTLNYPPHFDGHPQSRTVRSGQWVTLHVEVTAQPAAEVRWQISADGGIEWTDIPGASGADYMFLAKLDMDGYQFRALAVNDGGTAISEPALLTVDENRLYLPLMWGPER